MGKVEAIDYGLIRDVVKCQFCGFCESVCPTYNVMRERAFGPRGRINIIREYLNGSVKIGPKAFEGLMTCLNCRACNTQCPAGIRIAEAIHEFKALLLRGVLR
ncbi:(Fe-S)-binding protein [Vulcanisaeta thermophila]|uniref:(Fe-S)-binding protein n=1 Tax=Vulcanisaeta thermophila TaxID=867917 RepID=UPI000853EBEE|nr:(Fe-S)-binding protein [Vulcanisaeta thermophila]